MVSFLVPNISTYLSQTIAKTPLYDNVQSALNEYDREFQKEVEDKHHELHNELGPGTGFGWNMDGGYDGYIEICGIFQSGAKMYQRLNTWRSTVSFDYADKKWTLQRDYLDQLDRQEKLQQVISYLSPSEIFRQATEALCHTNAKSVLKYMESIRNYRQSVIQFFNDNRFFESVSYFTPQSSELFIDEREHLDNWNMEHFRGVFDNEKNDPVSYPNLNVDNMPRYQSSTIDTSTILIDALGSLLLLFVLIVLLLLGTILSFMKYDVR